MAYWVIYLGLFKCLTREYTGPVHAFSFNLWKCQQFKGKERLFLKSEFSVPNPNPNPEKCHADKDDGKPMHERRLERLEAKNHRSA